MKKSHLLGTTVLASLTLFLVVPTAHAQFSDEEGWGVLGHGGYSVSRASDRAPSNNSYYYPNATGRYGYPVLVPPGYVYFNQQYVPAYANGNSGFTAVPDDSAVIRVFVPAANAQVWVDGQQTRQQGIRRTYWSPPLERGSNYTYTLRASWDENGHRVTRERAIQVGAGTLATVTFADRQMQDQAQHPAQGESTPQASAAGSSTNPQRPPNDKQPISPPSRD
jgi:uncharacterized protein (TIGR03000 family)